MTKTRKFAEIAAATLIALAALGAATPAHAEEAAKKEYALSNQGSAGSILSFIRACDDADRDAKIVCRGGEAADRYPSAPANFNFGF